MTSQPARQPFTATNSPPDSPVHIVETGSRFDTGRNLEEGTALCLSGGGYRAMLFHLGSLWRLYELGMLRDLKRVSSVSGGSITAAVLGLKWSKLSFEPAAVRDDFVPEVVNPILKLADKTIDANSIIGGIFLPGTIGDKIADAYRDHLFGKHTLQDLPSDGEGPRFVINATNVQSGVLWRFSKPYMADYRVGMVKNPTVEVAVAVAASSAFPPVLSPVRLDLDGEHLEALDGSDLHRRPYTSEAVLSDGGVYDNLGLETAWKRHDTILVSDAGGQTEPEADPKTDWARHSYRILNLVDNQVRSLRKRQLIEAFRSPSSNVNHRGGAYWGIRSDIDDFELPDALPCPFEETLRLANTPTRLKRMPDELQERLINWGYAVCDAAVRRHVQPSDVAQATFPFAESRVG